MHMKKIPKKFLKVTAKTKYGWSDWQFPTMTSYLMKCCDCGLVHEMDFQTLVKYQKLRGRNFKVKPLDKDIFVVALRARRRKSP